MIIELPCGLLKNGVVYDRVRIGELKGKQQNYLVDAELITENFGHVPKILADLVSDFQTKEGLPAGVPATEAIWQVPTEDIEVMLLKVREATYGSVYAMPTICIHCGKEQLKKVVLSDLAIKCLPDKAIRVKEITLPKSGVVAKVKLLYLKDIFDLFKTIKEKKTELYTATTFLSLQQLGDKTPVVPEDIMELPLTDLQIIERTYLDMRGSIDLMITHECDKCGKEFSTPLGVMDPHFFVQSATLST